MVYGDLREEEGYTDSELAAVDAKLYQKFPEGILKHVDTVLGSDIIPIERIRQRHFRVGFNGQNASGNSYIKYLADRLNLELVAFHTEIGQLPEHPEPTPANLVDFKQFLADKKIDVGFAVDPDADRCVIVDEHGVPILEELTLAICIEYVLS